jgi:hypothetical protein
VASLLTRSGFSSIVGLDGDCVRGPIRESDRTVAGLEALVAEILDAQSRLLGTFVDLAHYHMRAFFTRHLGIDSPSGGGMIGFFGSTYAGLRPLEYLFCAVSGFNCKGFAS